MSYEYLLRVDLVGEESSFRQRLVDWVKVYKVIGCYEYHSGNHHYHFWIKCDKKLQAFRVEFKKKFPDCVGNKSYSLSQDEGNLNYICKGPEAPDKQSEPIIIVNTMYDDEDYIKSAHDQYWVDLNVFKQKKKKSSENSFLKALDYCVENGINVSSTGWQIASCLEDYYREIKMCWPGDFRVKNLCLSIQKELLYEYSVKNNKPHVYENWKHARGIQIIGQNWIEPRL